MTQGKIPSYARPRVAKVQQGVYSVFWMGHQVASNSPRMSGAKILARKIYSLTQRLQQMTAIDQAAFSQALNAFLSDSSDPSLGFDPPFEIV